MKTVGGVSLGGVIRRASDVYLTSIPLSTLENSTLGVITACPAVWSGHLTFLYLNHFFCKMRNSNWVFKNHWFLNSLRPDLKGAWFTKNVPLKELGLHTLKADRKQ